MPKYRQEVINIRIADILREMGFGAEGETISSGKLPDVMVEINGIRVNLEGWFEKKVQEDSILSRCRDRIEKGICNIAIALLYPEDLKEAENDEHLREKIKQNNYKVFVCSPSKTEGTFLGEMRIEQIAELLNRLYGEIINADLLNTQINEIKKAIEKACEIASGSNSFFFSSSRVIEDLKEALGIDEKTEVNGKLFKKDLIKMATFIIFDGLLFHQMLSSHHRNISGLENAPESKILNFIKEEWKKIMEINYLPIFTLAFRIIGCLTPSPETEEILRILISVALHTISSGVLLKHDLMGRVYHKLLLNTTGKYYASYYTSIPASSLLSNLIIKTENPDLEWNFESLNNVRNLKIIDPACGSGTLLSGIYTALKDKYILEHYRNPEKLDLFSFHKLMMEQILYGWDILDYAAHLTLTTLALHNPNSSFKSSNIHILHAGPDSTGKRSYLGSLSALELEINSQFILPLKELVVPLKKKGIREERIINLEKLEPMDIVIMNPPFSRSCQPNIKFGYTDKEIRERMNRALRRLGKKLGYQRIGQAGLEAYFIILADKLLKKGGRLGLVIPRAFLSGVSWEEIRGEILKNYEIEYIISNYDPGDKDSNIEPWNWSEKTNLGEVLIIARKTGKPFENRFTTFVNLWNKPKNEIESLKIASDAITTRNEMNRKKFLEGEGNYHEIKLNKKVIGVIYNLSQRYLKKNFLLPCIFSFPDLNRFLYTMVYRDLIPLIPLKEKIKSVGMDIAQIEKIFKLTESPTPFPIVWGYSNNLNTIELKKENYKYARCKNSQEEAERIYGEKSGRLLIAERIWTNTATIISMFSPTPIIATQFWEVNLEDISEEKILSLWLNSTFGFLLFLASAISNRQDRFTFKKSEVSNLLVLDTFYRNNLRNNLIEAFQRIKDLPFSSIPEEFKLASQGRGVRKQIDDAFINALKLKIDLQPYYEMLAKEPILTLKRL
jgi:type I restriction-modification system DNA methylase subunit